ncbi:MAG: hypothetical protein ACI8V2_000254 [Candidatus Latescibacterota bacterium]|jgi:hypothetical protein
MHERFESCKLRLNLRRHDQYKRLSTCQCVFKLDEDQGFNVCLFDLKRAEIVPYLHKGNTMVNPEHNESLYQQTLSTAQNELHTLNGQIEHLRVDLDRLERQKAAVESICHAIGQWVDARDIEQRASDEQDAFSFSGTVGLTEEEVSLIAYPTRLPHEA